MSFYRKTPRRLSLAALSLALLLSACGGGSSSTAPGGTGSNTGSGTGAGTGAGTGSGAGAGTGTGTGTDAGSGSGTGTGTGSGTGTGTDTGSGGTPPANQTSALEVSLQNGDASKLNDNTVDLIKAIKQELALRETEQSDLLNQVWAGDAISYAPGANSQLLIPQSSRESVRTYPLVVGSAGDSLAVAGTVQGGRVAAFGANVIGGLQAGAFPSMETPTRRLLSWLLTGQQQDVSAAREISLLRYSSGEQTALKAWFKAQYPNWTVTTCADDTQLSACTQSSKLLLVGSGSTTLGDANATLLGFLNQSLAAGKPVMYQHTGSWGDGGVPQIASTLGLQPFPYAGNYFDKDSASWGSKDAMVTAQPGALKPMRSISRLVDHLAAGDYSYSLAGCDDDMSCAAVPALNAEFFQGAQQLKSWISTVETSGARVFDSSVPKLLKYLVLLGDNYRSHIAYPMSKAGTPVNTFLKALYSDYAQATNRSVQPAANLQGSSFPGLTGAATETSANRSFSSRTVAFNTSAAVYALPGKAFTVTRTDSSAVKATVYINQVRNGANHVFGDNYNRPQFLWSNAIAIAPGQTLTLSQPTGGIVYVRLEKTDTKLDVGLKFSGVALQAAYTGPDSAATFASAVRSSPLGWAELLTPALEIHSTTEKMRQTLTNYGDNVGKLLSDMDTYMYRDIYNLAAFNGRDLALTTGAAAFCQAKGWDCTSWETHGLGGVQHFNADQANCGYMCSGQPIDSWGTFMPLGWGESHEIGHNLQYGHFKLYGGQTTEISNNIFPTHKWLHYNRDNPGGTQYGRDLKQQATFELLQAAQRQAAPADYVKNGLWFDENLFWGRLMFYWQAALDNRTSLGDEGWDLYRLLYLHDRQLSKAQASDATWSTDRAKLGFSDAVYASRSTVQSITAEDYLVVVMSYITGRDQRNFFDMWGIKYSATASTQVAAYGFPATSKRFWVIPCESKGFKAPLAAPVAVDGLQAWPAAGNCTP